MRGDKTVFWEDSWLYSKSMKELYPLLYRLCTEKDITVEETRKKSLNLNFRRWLYPELETQWVDICDRVNSFEFRSNNDVIVWRWDKDKIFTVKSMYKALSAGRSNVSFKHI